MNELILRATVQELDKRVQLLAKACMTLTKVVDEHEKRIKELEERLDARDSSDALRDYVKKSGG